MNQSKNSLSFWLGTFCIVLGAAQAACSFLGLSIEINLIVEVVAAALCALVCLGVLKAKKGASAQETFFDIKKTLKDSLEKPLLSQQKPDENESENKEKKEG